MPFNRYITVTPERYNILCDRHIRFVKNAEDHTKEPIKVFDPLSKKHLEELELIREISRELVKKKNDDLKKAEQQAQEAEAKAAEIAANKAKATETEETPAEA